MNGFLAQVAPPTLFNAPADTSDLYLRLAVGVILGIAMVVACMYAPTRARRFIVGGVTFLAGLIFVAKYFWPAAVTPRSPGELPRDVWESGAFFLDDLVTMVADFSNILTGFLLGLGIYSLLRIHAARLIKKQRDWFFSAVLLVCLFGIMIIGLVHWSASNAPDGVKLADRENWGTLQYVRDFLFDGLLQEMDAAFFSIIAFYILSAAYRAFRIRSIEATILLATALIVMLSLMGAVEYQWGQGIDSLTGKDPASFLNNFKLTQVSGWLRTNVQDASLRAIQFGIGIGALAMGLRLWLSLERGGARS